MGCDIHIHAEKKSAKGYKRVIFGDEFEPFSDRDYGTFGFLADVRITPPCRLWRRSAACRKTSQRQRKKTSTDGGAMRTPPPGCLSASFWRSTTTQPWKTADAFGGDRMASLTADQPVIPARAKR